MMLIGGNGDPQYGWTAKRIVEDDPQDCPWPTHGLTCVVIVPATLSNERMMRLVRSALPGTYIGIRRSALSPLEFKVRAEVLVLNMRGDVKIGQVHELDAVTDIAPQATNLARWHGLDGTRQHGSLHPSDVFGRAAHMLCASFPDPELMISGTASADDPGGWLTGCAWLAARLGMRGILWSGGPVQPPDDAWEEACRIAALSE